MPGPGDLEETKLILKVGAEVAEFARQKVIEHKLNGVPDFVTLIATAHAHVIAFAVSKGSDHEDALQVSQKLLRKVSQSLIDQPKFDA
jgi:hypothetical protein